MTETPQFLPASSFTLDALAEIFTRCFENYFYSGLMTVEILARRVRVEQIDLHRSLVMMVGGTPAGIALVALRGDQAWCGGFGVVLPLRGRSLARPLAAAMLEAARQAGARQLSLEVLTRNQRAISVYTGMGLRPRRDLQVFEWQRSAATTGTAHAASSVTATEVDAPARLLDHFAALHPVPAAWQRDLPALLAQGGFRALAIETSGMATAYVLFQVAIDGSARIEDLGATNAEQAGALLAVLQTRAARIVSVNEPAESPLTGAFLQAGFAEVDRQHELWIDL